jgi:predicted outer membrane repeat protein
MTIRNSSFTGNFATDGGAIDNSGSLTINHTGFTGNSATSYFLIDYGGGINNTGALTVNSELRSGTRCPG